MARPRRGVEMGVLLLIWQLINSGLEHFPPVTLIVMAGQVGLYMGLIPVSWDAGSVCLSAQAVLKWREYERLFLSAFEHGDDIHLYYNMLSFLSKGRSLELHFGSPYFAYLLTVFTLLTSSTYIGLEVLLSEVMQDKQHYKTCAIGFSGVIFALKVLTTHYWEADRNRRYFGIRVSGRYAVWLELVAIQLMVPNASFIGHLAGILVGVMYTQGPLQFLMDIPLKALSLLNHHQPSFSANRNTDWGSGVSGTRAHHSPTSYGWASERDDDVTNEDYDEAIRRSYETFREDESGNTSASPSAPPYQDLLVTDSEEVRRRRLARFTASQ